MPKNKGTDKVAEGRSMDANEPLVNGKGDMERKNDKRNTEAKNPSSFPPPEGRPVEVYKRVPPDGGWGWVVVVASFFANFIMDGILYCYGVFIPKISEDFNQPQGTVSIPGSLLAGFYLMTSPVTGVLANKFGFQIVTVSGALFAAVAFGFSSLAMNIEYLIIIYGVLGGIGFGMVYAPSIVMVGLYFDKWRAVATGIAVCGSGIGTFSLSPLNHLFMDLVGWKRTFLIHAGIILILVVCGMMYRPIKPTKVTIYETDEAESSPKKEDDEGDVSEKKKKNFCTNCWAKVSDLFDFSLMKSLSFDLLLLSGTLTLLGYFTPFSYLKDRALKEGGWEVDDTVWLISIIGISNTVGRVVTGLISGLPRLDATSISAGALIIAGLSTMLSEISLEKYYQYTYCAIYGFSTAALASLRSIMVVDLLGLDKLNNAFAILLFVQGLASAVGSPLSGLVYDATKSYKISFYYSGALILISGILLIPLKRINRYEKNKKLKSKKAEA